MSDERRALRAAARRLRDGLSQDERHEASLAICRALRALPAYRRARCVMLFSPIGSEADLRPLLSDDKDFCFPRCGPGPGEMDAYRCTADGLVPGAYGVAEPDEHCPRVDPLQVDLVVVPCLAFDGRGYRLGYGAGYYDRYLPRLRPDAVRVLAAFAQQRVGAIPPRAGEFPADFILTQAGCSQPPTT